MQRVTPRGGKRDFGLGWFRSHQASGRRPAFVEHLGGGAGFWCVMRIYPEESLGLVVMGNTTSYDHESVCDAIVSVPWEWASTPMSLSSSLYSPECVEGEFSEVCLRASANRLATFCT
jgi:CubicO group peptidase (beta-lactamase class C family)